MKYILKPSLECMALVKIVATLWSQNDVRILMVNFNMLHFSKGWQKIEDRVTKKVQQLSLPGHLKKKLSCFIKPVGLQILTWIEYHCTSSYFYLDLPAEFCWTPQGTINQKRTAEMLIKDGNLDIFNCFKLACIYCLDDYVHELWNKIPEELKKNFLHENFSNEVVFLWTCGIGKEGWDTTLFSCKTAFKSSAIAGNKAAVEYFLQKLTPKEREVYLIYAAKLATEGDVLCFLLSKMDTEQQNEVFESDPYQVLQRFLNWPLQSLFIEMASCMWDFLSKVEYDNLLDVIIHRQVLGYKDFSYQKLFEEFWQKGPIPFKKHVINGFRCLSRLLNIKDKENCMLILKDATAIEKKELIYCYSVQFLFDHLICDGEWDFLQWFLLECLPSKGEMLKFKEDFEKQIMMDRLKDLLTKNKQKWDNLFCLSDDSSSKESENSSKRLRRI